MSASDRQVAIDLVQEACTKGARKHKACEILELSTRTLERWKREGVVDQRKGADKEVGNKLSEEERKLILKTINSSDYCDLPPCKIVPLLADTGVYIASESTIYRILRKERQLSHRGLSQPRKHNKPEAHEATGPNQLWSWDITYLPTQVRGLYFYLYMIMDVYSRKIVGWTIQHTQSGSCAADLIQQACIDEQIKRHQVILHSDNGAPMKASTMLAKMESLGVAPSFSRPSVSDDNPFSESLFRTIKYHPTFPLTEKFETIFDARRWVMRFTQWYNTEHLHSGLKFITPTQRHTGVDESIMNNRHKVYLEAKKDNPERWSGQTRNWRLPAVVRLNANRKKRMAERSNLGGLEEAI